MKYNFWLKNIITPNEFCDLCDVREYLIQNNNFNTEQTTEQLQLKLNNLYDSIQLKSIKVINEVYEILKPEQNKTIENTEIKSIIENKPDELKTNEDIKIQMVIKEHKEDMKIKIKMLEIENEKLKENEASYSRQIKSLSKGLEFRNQKLIKNRENLTLLKKEKNDLICTIEKMEIKGEGLQTLKNKLEKEQEKNKNLSNIIENEFEKTNGIYKNIH